MRLHVLVGIAVILFGFLARPLLLNQVPIEFDLGRYHLPLRDFYQRCLLLGDDPAWCPQLFCGYDLHGEGQAGMDHPWHRILYSFLPLTVAFNLELFANYPILCLGMYLFLRRHDLPRDAALAGALTMTFGGFTLPHYAHTNAIAIVAHMPWLLWLTDIYWRDDRARARAGAGMSVAILTGSQILLGYPQYVYFSCLAELIYLLMLIMSDRSWRSLAGWLMFKTLGVGIGGAQLLPSLLALNLSPRMGYDAAFRGMLSLPWEMLLQLFAPTQFNVGAQLHEYGVYGGSLAGIATLLFLSGGLPLGRRDVLNRLALALIIIAVPLALGRHTPLFQFYLKLPIVGVFRCPCRYLVLGHFAAAILVARLVQRLANATDQHIRWRQLWLIAALPIAALAAIAVDWTTIFSDECQKFIALGYAGVVGAVSLTIASLLALASARGRAGALTLLIIFGFADLGYWGFRSIFGTHDTPVHRFVGLDEYRKCQLVPPAQPAGRLQLADVHGNGAMMLGWKLTSGYVGLSPPRSLDVNSLAGLRLAGTTWRLIDDFWQPVDGVPKAHWDHEGQHPGAIAFVTDRPGLIAVNTTSTQAGQLIMVESFHPCWRVTIDGEAAELLQTNGGFQSCDVPAGSHQVIFKYDPWARAVGRAMSWASLALAVIMAVWLDRRRSSTMMK